MGDHAEGEDDVGEGDDDVGNGEGVNSASISKTRRSGSFLATSFVVRAVALALALRSVQLD